MIIDYNGIIPAEHLRIIQSGYDPDRGRLIKAIDQSRWFLYCAYVSARDAWHRVVLRKELAELEELHKAVWLKNGSTVRVSAPYIGKHDYRDVVNGEIEILKGLLSGKLKENRMDTTHERL